MTYLNKPNSLTIFILDNSALFDFKVKIFKYNHTNKNINQINKSIELSNIVWNLSK